MAVSKREIFYSGFLRNLCTLLEYRKGTVCGQQERRYRDRKRISSPELTIKNRMQTLMADEKTCWICTCDYKSLLSPPAEARKSNNTEPVL